ncbi:MAG: hypothetical protein AB7T49_16375 [Oligoflexales bacterium]
MRMTRKLLALSCLMAMTTHCKKKESDPKTTQTKQDGGYNGETDEEDLVAVSGTLNVQALRLAGADVTHVVALETETGATAYGEVAADGSFALDIDKDKPWVITYIDSSQTGADMIVSMFASETLDTMNVGEDVTDVSLGTVDASDEKAEMDVSAEAFLDAIGMSEDTAETVGAVDDVSLRYSNPDIDNNGEVDSLEEKSYMIDFHNRFTAKTADGSTPLTIQDMKNQFYPDNAVFSYTGTGVVPQIPKSDLDDEAPDTYAWTFSVDMPTATNGGEVCDGMAAGDTITAGTECTLEHSDNSGANGDNLFAFGIETSNLQSGDYTLNVGSKTYTWKNVAVSDFSAGEGFLVLFTQIDVDDNTNKITGLSYKWQIKGADGVYTPATDEVIKTIVKGDDNGFGGYVSLKYLNDESKGSLGVMIPRESSGSIVFADAIEADDETVRIDGSELTEDMVLDGVLFSDFTGNPGISYDDKLGMRFFF